MRLPTTERYSVVVSSSGVSSEVDVKLLQRYSMLNANPVATPMEPVESVTTLPDNKLFAQMLYPGDLFVFPRGLVHFQLNVGKEPAVAMAGFNSQNPGATQVAKAVFDSNPPINDDVIAKAFQIDDRGLIQKLRELIGMT
ncbi:germin-like protein subfamily 1 member 10 [Selaginella moellendorffii]|uniref:germin-like protein subfamily 1 member 10 n=1 Tax=Selaginella moellendorffii TaxID=88036 RepID=UPI000D1C455C|nr:germin-like protein subfamily 1 member 10 [Selaginella moellendorffii]|eukprot:XP_024520773.1 germin-like protein subfamily 1 member 10 [Selaginella moellendorffii]